MLSRLSSRPVCQGVPPLEGIPSHNAVYSATPDHRGVVTSDDLNPAERERLDKEVAALSKQSDGRPVEGSS